MAGRIRILMLGAVLAAVLCLSGCLSGAGRAPVDGPTIPMENGWYMQEEYDENGLLTVRREYTDRHVFNMEYRYTYDDAGMLICCEEYIGGEHFNQKQTYSYREDGKLQEEKIYDPESLRTVVEYLYDESGTSTEQWKHIYDNSGNIEKTSFFVYDSTTENKYETIWIGEQRYSNGKVIYYYKSYPPYDDDYNDCITIYYETDGSYRTEEILNNEHWCVVTKYYDAMDHLTSTIKQSSGNEREELDFYENGALWHETITDPDGRTVYTEYSATGIKITVAVYHYDEAQNITSHTTERYDKNGILQQIETVENELLMGCTYYNEAGQITLVEEYVRSQNGKPVTIYMKDADGNLIQTHHFEYNENDYIVRDYYQMPDGKITEEEQIHYKDDGGWFIYKYRNGMLIYSSECDKDGNILWQKNH